MTQVNLNISLRPTPELVTLVRYLSEALQSVKVEEDDKQRRPLEIIPEGQKEAAKPQEKTPQEQKALEQEVQRDVAASAEALNGFVPTIEQTRALVISKSTEHRGEIKLLLSQFGVDKVPALDPEQRKAFYKTVEAL